MLVTATHVNYRGAQKQCVNVKASWKLQVQEIMIRGIEIVSAYIMAASVFLANCGTHLGASYPHSSDAGG